MIHKIFKYDLGPTLERGLWVTKPIELEMPQGAMIMDVQWNQGGIKLWAQVDHKEERMSTRRFCLVGTGNCSELIADDESYYIGTVQQPGVSTPQVWHVYEL